ncbi:uncharacterized protein LOC119027027 [Acanthopagrus latus]|uniref:uncharacterized protein LOC119027027 n=1 Tax=Acanthopagrus latus TaxID=8177 RepID=UPI00187C2BD9|nr:uncharacterized protein LOC119027027 [Acanthopagrus latus]
MKMILMVLLVVLTSSVCVMSAGKKTATFYQAEEDDDITMGWVSPIRTDMSLTNMRCFLWSNPSKLLYEMVNSIDVPESQDPQFAGRVQCDKDALRDGQIRLHVSRLKTEDSGNYWCDLNTNYDKVTERWLLVTTEHFVLNVTSRGENRGHKEHNIITPASTEDTEHTAGGPKKKVKSHDMNKVATGAVLLIGAIICLLGVAQSCLSALIRRFTKDQHQDRPAII